MTLREEILEYLDSCRPALKTCKEISSHLQKEGLNYTSRQVYDCIPNMPMPIKLDLNIVYGAGLFLPNKYGFK
jgi:hypothetical protein